MATAIRAGSAEQQAGGRPGSGWRWLYWLGGAASIFTPLIIPGQLAIFIAAPQPHSVLEWFELFQQSPLIGLLSFELLFVLNTIFSVLFLAIYQVLLAIALFKEARSSVAV